MRVDLSRVSFISIRQEWNIDEINGDPSIHNSNTSKIFSNRQHVLLFQQQNHKISRSNRGSSTFPYSSNKTPSTTSEMSKLTFLNIFDNHKPDEIEKLDRLYTECKGTLPSRRQLSAIAQSIGIQQSKIKKWFDKCNQESEKPQDNIKYQSEDQFWNNLNRKLDQVDTEIEKIKSNF